MRLPNLIPTDCLLSYFSTCPDIFHTNIDQWCSVNDNAGIRVLGLHKEMADKRKLQGEIDRCMKKVTEGVEVFEDLWQKIYSTTNINIKEKHEADLKKEIKKLQRLRDHIKNWLASTDVKDKENLLEYKRLIETQMERFKVVERETKTKAYSKEGLGSLAKVDPKEKEKEVIFRWLYKSIDDLKLQTDQTESEIEGLSAKKKKIDRDKQDQIDLCKYLLERLKFHISRLELIMRLLDNDALPIDQIQRIREDMDYYISSNREVGFEENEFLYDDLNLDEISAALGAKMVENAMSADDETSTTMNCSDTTSLPSSSCPSPTPSNLSHNTSNKEEVTRERKKSHSEDFQAATTKLSIIPNLKPQHPTSSNNLVNRSLPFTVRSNNELQQLSSHHVNSLTISGQNYAQVASLGVYNHQESNNKPGSLKADTSDGKANQKPPHVSPRLKQNKQQQQHSITTSTTTLDNIDKRTGTKSLSLNSELSEVTLTGPPTSEDASLDVSNHLRGPTVGDIVSAEIATGLLNDIDDFHDNDTFAKKVATKVSNTVEDRTSTVSATMLLSLTTTTSIGVATTSNVTVVVSTVLGWPSVSMSSALSLTSSVGQSCNGLLSLPSPIATAYSLVARPAITPAYGNLVVGANIPPSRPPYNLSVPPMPSHSGSPLTKMVKVDLACMFGKKPLTTSENLDAERLSASLDRFPQAMDSRWLSKVRIEDLIRLKLEEFPEAKPFSDHVPHSFFQEAFYQNLNCETLFFVFYYMDGSLAQFLAAKALKNQSWRFHTKYFTWFQRLMDPSIITEEYEQGSYTYFDFTDWTQKNLETFTFEYKYLEDKEL